MLLRRGRILESVTLGWNVAGIAVLAAAAVAARSVALAGFGLDSLIEIGASVVVLWELSGSGQDRQRRALRLIGGAFVALAVYLTIQSVLVLVTGYRPGAGGGGGSGHSGLHLGSPSDGGRRLWGRSRRGRRRGAGWLG